MKVDTNPKKIEEVLTRGIKEVIDKKHLKERLLSGERLRIKFGVDPSKPDIHLGHSVPLKKLQAFQEIGHQIVFIIGDFTGRIGDPSDRSKTRPQLSIKQVNQNAETYLEQVRKMIDVKKVEIRRNSEWYDKMNPDDFIRLFSKITLARILERDDFEKRMKEKIDIYPHEIIYPILQGYDSIVVKSDIEIGGTDQLFNMLMGRKLQKRFNQPQQDVMTVSLLIGLDGKDKMSKSLGNYIGVTESRTEQYGKIMSVPDDLIVHYFELATNVSLEEIARIKKDLKLNRINPKNLKQRLAREIVALYYNKKAAKKAEEEFERIFKEKKLPSKIPEIKITEKSLNILDLMIKTKIAPSKSEAKRLILQKGVKIDNKVQDDWQKEIEAKKGMIIQAGKRRFVKII